MAVEEQEVEQERPNKLPQAVLDRLPEQFRDSEDPLGEYERSYTNMRNVYSQTLQQHQAERTSVPRREVLRGMRG